ncbi:hypothetical protein M378DRAFT_164678 [Amanita muscaria Koide BX008]|uniref:Uncharacterized protein n=1 Tax=Amanita muscaria (strain Koide BX008) TaxID=946122 RepID=A0A0C2X3R0_AMAMK|nr:hypothetical protein M378DRAFT_164678 [Amanita muscaria Koide BX008]
MAFLRQNIKSRGTNANAETTSSLPLHAVAKLVNPGVALRFNCTRYENFKNWEPSEIQGRRCCFGSLFESAT